MKCPNPACQKELFFVKIIRKEANILKGIVEVDGQKIKIALGPSVKLRCSNCGHEVKAWIPNSTLIKMVVILQSMNEKLTHVRIELQEMKEQLNQSIWKKLSSFFPHFFKPTTKLLI